MTPTQERYVKTHDGLELYARQFGAHDGIPALFLHGGPGAPFRDEHTGFFDLGRYRLVSFHQRGCGLSRPHLALAHNTIENQLADIEAIRTAFGMDDGFILVGNSWGTALAQIYATRHADKIRHMVLAAVSFADRVDADFFVDEEGGAHVMRPEYFAEYRDFARAHDAHKKLGDIYYELVFSEDEKIARAAARQFVQWNASILTLTAQPELLQAGQSDENRMMTLAKLFLHYYRTQYSPEGRTWIWPHLDVLRPIPTTILHGQYDMICPPQNAYDLHQELENSTLVFVPQAGHFSLEPEFAAEFLAITTRLTNEVG